MTATDPHRPSPRDFGSRIRRDPAGSTRPPQRTGWQRINVEIPDRLFQEIKSYSGEERVSVARWIASATTQAAKGYREGFRFDHHGGKKVTDE